jgi:hypothetical protein
MERTTLFGGCIVFKKEKLTGTPPRSRTAIDRRIQVRRRFVFRVGSRRGYRLEPRSNLRNITASAYVFSQLSA